MAPNQKSNDRDGHAGERDEIVAEDFFSRKAGDDFADHAHARQNHDVNRRMRIKPKQMLEQNRVAAEFGIENADAPNRSSAMSASVMASTGVASTRMMLVEYMDQMKNGIRNHVSPGARIFWIVMMKFSPVRIEPNPAMKIPAAISMTCVFE